MSKQEKTGDGSIIDRFEYVPGEHNPFIICRTCREIAHFPKATCKKSHIHCEPCIVNCTCCPSCGKTPHFSDSAWTSEILEEMEVYCSSKFLGCTWQGKQCNAISHLRQDCVFNFCPRQQVGCVYSGTKKEISDHEDVCGYVPVSCPNKCNAKLLRNEIESHDDECQVLLDAKKKEENEKLNAARLLQEQVEAQKRKDMLELEEKRKKAQQNTGKKVIQEILPKPEEIVSLNVGGTSFLTSKLSLMQSRSSAFFSCLLESKCNMNESFFLDRNPESFALMLEYLRCGSAFPMQLKSKEIHLLLAEAIFWCIPQLAEELMRFLHNSGSESLEIYSLDYCGRDFSRWNFRKVNFTKCKFDESSFDNSVVSDVQFLECSFDTCSFKETTFQQGTMSKCSFRGANLENLSLLDVSLISDCQFSGAVTRGTIFSKQMQGQCNFTLNEITDDFTGLNLSAMVFENADLTACKLINTDMSSCNLQRIKLPNEGMQNVSFAKANFCNSDLSTILFESCTLDKANFKETILPVNLGKVSLKQTNLSARVLSSSFVGSDLSGCNLERSRMKGDFSNCTLAGSQIKGSVFKGAKLEKTILPQDLTFCSFIDVDLSMLSSSKHKVAGLKFKKCKISFELFDGNLTKCDFSNCVVVGKVSGLNFKGVKLQGTDMRNCFISECNFSGSFLSGILFPPKLEKTQFSDLDFSKVLLKNEISFSSCKFEEILFPCDVSKVSFNKSDVLRCNFSKTKVSGSRFVDCQVAENLFPLDLSDCDFSRSSLSGFDISKHEITGTNFAGCKLSENEKFPQNLSAFDISNRDLSGYDFSQHVIIGANFTNSNLNEVKFPKEVSGCNFSNCDLSKSDLSERDFSSCTMQEAAFCGSLIKGVKFPSGNLQNCNFSQCDLAHLDFSSSDITGAAFVNSGSMQTTLLPKNLKNCNFSTCNFTQFDLSNRNLFEANFSEANLSGANLSAANLSEANLCGANLSEANLSGANLSAANLSNCKLTNTKLPKELSKCILANCDLSNWDFSEANLSEANLSGANLSEANLSEANLSGANLSGANLSEANFSGAKLSGANCTNAILKGIKTTPSTSGDNVQTNIFRGSKLLSLQEKIQLQTWAGGKSGTQLLYRVSDHGDAGSTFHQKCDGRGETFVIAKCSAGNIFGGFASVSWNSSGSFIKAPDSFLFSLRNPHRDPPTKFSLKNDKIGLALYGESSYGPIFGGGWDIFISNNCTKNNSSYINFPSSYEDSGARRGQKTFTGARKFIISDFEVFCCSD